jgi:hypothetical protein
MRLALLLVAGLLAMSLAAPLVLAEDPPGPPPSCQPNDPRPSCSNSCVGPDGHIELGDCGPKP